MSKAFVLIADERAHRNITHIVRMDEHLLLDSCAAAPQGDNEHTGGEQVGGDCRSACSGVDPLSHGGVVLLVATTEYRATTLT